MFREKPVDDNKAASKIAVTSSLRSFPSVPYLSRLICSPEAKRIRPARSAHKRDQQKIISPRRRRHCPPRRAPPTKIGTERRTNPFVCNCGRRFKLQRRRGGGKIFCIRK